jgi:pyruvate/2-oxoglutarate dehydrogenase complex dihydrolipoamide dehydrogenase (E3) component
MPADHYDLIVLGAGSAARAGAQKASQEHGAKVALVESTRWGGSCPNVACKPTKAYLVVAELVRDVNRLANIIGIDVGPARADLARIKARKDSLKKPQPRWCRT